jgi:hypothetical protein
MQIERYRYTAGVGSGPLWLDFHLVPICSPVWEKHKMRKRWVSGLFGAVAGHWQVVASVKVV